MSATYNLFKNPGKGDNLHARQVNQYTVRIDALCEEISQISSFSSSDVKGMLEALKSRIAFHLKYGDIVELEGLGTFNASLKCPSLPTEKQITPHLVRFNKVVFRCSNELKKELRYMKVERAGTKPSERIHGREAENEYIELHTAKQHDLYPRMPFHQWLLEVYRLERSPDIVG